MRKYVFLICVALLFALPLGALAEAKLGDTIYGPWSEWTEQLPPNADELDVETEQITRMLTRETYTYRRYKYFHLMEQKWYVTSTDRPGDVEEPGSGHWVERTFEQKRPLIGIVNREKCYEGQWFFEQAQTEELGEQTVQMYRYRTQSKVQCVLEAHDIALARGETHAMKYQVPKGTAPRFVSSDVTIATVDAKGIVTAHEVGDCRIDVMIGERRVESLQLYVGERVAGFSPSAHTIQLVGSDSFLAPVGGVAQTGSTLFAASYIPAELRCFQFVGAAENAFRIRLVSPKVMYVTVREKDGRVGLAERISKKTQIFSVLRLEGGQDLIHLASDPTKFLAINSKGVPVMKPFEGLRSTIRWKLTSEVADEKTPEIWAVPYQRNGTCYVSQDFHARNHKGLDVGSYGKRVPALSVASGVVMQVYAGCEHDYGKPMNADGSVSDPCGSSRSYGNFVRVRHPNGHETLYAHLSRIMVRKGDRVNQGDIIGTTGSSGSSTAVHLHLEVHDSVGNALDPRQFITLPEVDLNP